MSGFPCDKTCRPQLQQVYPRERLHVRLDRCLERPLVWVAGPGGSGKSTLVAHYLELRDLPAIWYRLDGRDADGATLFHCLGNVVTSTASCPLPLSSTECQTTDASWVRGWFREFFRGLSSSTVMVFDDVHVGGGESEFYAHLTWCLEELPDTFRIIVISREALPPRLSEYRQRGLLYDLTWDDLRVTPEEAVGIAGTVLGEGEVEEFTVKRLHSKSNGWMAGLLLCLRHGIPTSELLLPDSVNVVKTEASPQRLTIHCLGRFELHLDGAPVAFSGKAPKKPLEVLKILLAHGGRSVATGVFIEALWPDAVGDAAMDSLTTTLQRLRTLLGSEKVIRVHHSEVSLDRQRAWVDAWEFEDLSSRAREALCPGDESQSEVIIRQAVALYRGHFLPCDSDKPWSFACRERLRGKFAHHAGVLCRRLDEQGETRQAITCYRDGLEIDHLSEEFYQQLMLCYLQAGLHAEAAVAYQTCRKNLALHLGIAPSPRTEEIFRMIQDYKAL